MAGERCVLVTGGARGIGRSIVQKACSGRLGCRCHLPHGPPRSEGTGPHSRCQDAPGGLTDRAKTVEFAHRICDEFSLDALVNNAGILQKQPFEEMTLDAWDRTLEVNVTAPLILAQAIGPRLSPGGSIVNIASTDAYVGSYRGIAYSASKAALLSVTRSLANVLGSRNVRVNAVTPGWVDSGILPDSYTAANLTPLGRNGSPEGIAKVVAFLLSPEAGFITGASIVADGGYTGADYFMKTEDETFH